MHSCNDAEVWLCGKVVQRRSGSLGAVHLSTMLALIAALLQHSLTQSASPLCGTGQEQYAS